MKLQHLKTFVVVYQERSFTAAAARIYATQSGLSMQIKELEDDLGVKLFDRSTRGVIPTVAGVRYYDHAVSALRALEDARRDMRDLQGELMGVAVVGLMPTFTRAVLAPAMNEFAGSHPHVSVKIIEAYSAVLTEGVAREELDIAMVPPSGADRRLCTKYVSRDRELFVTRAQGDRKHLSSVALREAGPLRLIVPSSGNARRARVDEHLHSNGAEVAAILEMDAMMGTLELVANSDWTAILPATLCYPDMQGLVRHMHPIVDPPLFVDYVQITPATRTTSPAVAAFAKVLTKHVLRIARDWDEKLAQV